jgi:hypothetical protein
MSICSTSPKSSVAKKLVVGPNEAEVMLDCGHTYLYQLINAGELDSYCDGKSRKITVASIEARIRRKLQEAKAA